ncbi:MAG: hypothetical protein WKF75_05015 [Singulisphaera sp.]
MSTRIRGFRLGAIAVALIAIGADAPPQTIEAGGMTFQAPASWKSSKPSSTMRRAQLKVDPAEGDPEPAELVVFAFPGGAGTVEANVSRWQAQFKDKDGKPPKIVSKTIKGKNVEVIRVETGGHFVAPESPGSPKLLNKPDFHLLGAIVQTPSTGYFFKMIGPEKTMAAAEAGFDRLITSITVAADGGK